MAPPAGSAPSARAVRKRSVTIAGHRTSVSLEQAFWDALRTIADARGLSVAAVIAEIDAANGRLPGPDRAANLSSALRVHVLEQARAGALR
ncbi:MAG: ribbon-helix-helix domain-containing protein [Alphaproteobacteria bacterium]|nr:ribbon-helix-helix domain-containing protein [Alphaproteobacteria bacterium]